MQLDRVSITMDMLMAGYNSLLDDFEFIESSNRQLHTAINGVTTAVQGNTDSTALVANTAVGSGDAGSEFLSGFTAQGFTLDILQNIVDGDAVMVAWSTTANDEVALSVILDTLRVSIGVPDKVFARNTFVITVTTKSIPVPMQKDGVTIKTIAVAAVGSKNYTVLPRLVS